MTMCWPLAGQFCGRVTNSTRTENNRSCDCYFICICQNGMVMEPTSDRRFDPLLGVQLLLEIAQERSVEPILKKIVENAVESAQFVYSQVWLIKKGDLCDTCKYRSECADRSRCLHLVAGRGRALPSPERNPQPYEDLNARVPPMIRWIHGPGVTPCRQAQTLSRLPMATESMSLWGAMASPKSRLTA